MPLPDPGLVLHLPMREDAGLTAYDASRYGNDGALTGCKWVEHGLEFNGSSDYMDCGNNSSIDITDEITISVLAKIDSFPGGTDYDYILSKKPVYSVGGAYAFGIRGDDGFYFGIRNPDNSGYNYVLAGGALTTGTWYNLVGTFNSSGYGTIYKNGVFVSTNDFGFTGIYSNSDHVTIGSASGSNFFNGLIDQPRIHNRALSAAEIKRAYKREVHNYV